MTRFIHDQFAKQVLTELLTSLGQVETSKDITAEIRQIDVFFVPAPEKNANLPSIGLLGRLVTGATLLEPFRNPITKGEIRSCLGKLFALQASGERLANRDNTRLSETDLPYLWMLTPTASAELLQSAKATEELENWGKGIYFLPEVLKAGIIVIHQLEPTPETLWLRILGRGRVQQQAIEELEALPADHPQRETVLELVYDLLAVLEARQQTQKDLEPEEQELIMQLSPIYRHRLEEATQEGRKEGRQEERRNLIESLLQVRFGSIDRELAAIIEPLMDLEAGELTPLLLQLSREELLTRFSH
jgi:hypothetical protein